MKNILIIYPPWPPSNLAGVQRVRLISNFLPYFIHKARLINQTVRFSEFHVVKKAALILASLKKQLKIYINKGNKYTCPFCIYSSKDLAVIGFDFAVLKEKDVIGGGLRKGGCFKCGSSDRERLVYMYLKDKVGVFEMDSSKKILHIAPEKNISKQLLKNCKAEYVCGDLFTEGYSYPEHVKNINILHIPYKDDTFDLIICNHVLEHIPEDTKAMKELYRVLKAGGQAILQVPISNKLQKTQEDLTITDPKEREIIYGQFDHVRLYGQDYAKRLENSGFTVNRINLFQEFHKYGVNPNENLFIASK